MAINILRRNSDTPTVRGQDDARVMRYAVGGLDGILKGYGDECAYGLGGSGSVEGNYFIVNSGDIILNGWQCIFEAGGERILLRRPGYDVYYTVYLELDLRNPDEQKVELKASYSLGEYPVIDTGDDLTENPTGIRRLVLYHVHFFENGATHVDKIVGTIPYEYEQLNSLSSRTTDVEAEISAHNRSISDIEKRLDDLGFKTGTISGVGAGQVVSSSLKKQGKFVLLESATIRISGGNRVSGGFQLDNPSFYPKAPISFLVSPSQGDLTNRMVTLGLDGKVVDLAYTTTAGADTVVSILHIGWETD